MICSVEDAMELIHEQDAKIAELEEQLKLKTLLNEALVQDVEELEVNQTAYVLSCANAASATIATLTQERDTAQATAMVLAEELSDISMNGAQWIQWAQAQGGTP